MDLCRLDTEILGRHDEEHVGKPFYDHLVAFMSRGPVVAMVVEGPEDTWEVVRAMMGATNPVVLLRLPRGDLGIDFTENLVHGSDSLASAGRGTIRGSSSPVGSIRLFDPFRGASGTSLDSLLKEGREWPQQPAEPRSRPRDRPRHRQHPDLRAWSRGWR